MNFTLEDAQEATTEYIRTILGGQPGGGKSYTALLLANQFVQRTGGFVGVIETEQGRSVHYGDRFPHKLVRLPDTSPDTYIEAMRFLARKGCKVLVIDSLTHAWGGVKDTVNRAAKEKFGGNTWGGWSIGKAQQQKLIDAISRYPGFVICTCRMKLATEQDEKGKVHTVGLQFEQALGIEYEFDIAARMDVVNLTSHELTILKSVLGEYLPVGTTMTDPDEHLAQMIFRWFDRGGARPAAQDATATRPATPAATHFDEEVEPEFEYHIEDNNSQNNGTSGPPPQDLPGAPTESASKSRPTGKSWNVPARSAQDKEHPVTEQQIVSLKKLGKALGYGEDVPTDMTGAQAGLLISRLSGEYQHLRRQGDLGAGGGPGVNQRAAAERAAQSPARPASATATATRDAYPNDDPFSEDDE